MAADVRNARLAVTPKNTITIIPRHQVRTHQSLAPHAGNVLSWAQRPGHSNTGTQTLSLRRCGQPVGSFYPSPHTATLPPAHLSPFFQGIIMPVCHLSVELAMRHVISALVHNVPGVLSHISGMLASRGYNIVSLAVGETDRPDLSRMTFVVHGDERVLEQVRKQLEKIVTVVQVEDISAQDFVERDLMLVRVSAPPGGQRSEVRELTEIFRGRIVDVGAEDVVIEIAGQETKIQAFIERIRRYGITDLVRTGRIAMVRSEAKADDPKTNAASEAAAGK